MRRSTLILSALLALSVAINLLVAGIIIGHRSSSGRGSGPGDMGGSDRTLSAVPQDLRAEVRDRLARQGDAPRQHLDAMRAARRAAGEAVRARPFDPVAAKQALANVREETARSQERLHAAIVETLQAAQEAGTLPPPPRGNRRPPSGERPEAQRPQ